MYADTVMPPDKEQQKIPSPPITIASLSQNRTCKAASTLTCRLAVDQRSIETSQGKRGSCHDAPLRSPRLRGIVLRHGVDVGRARPADA